ncbi:MAG: radical SAM family heme chaperone HemW, partial [Eubacteriales bacterium]|nr:radical SAM family heme chaperone HemW [Eubacteriales bacterium]
MQGLYVHIPFCRSKCAYCDFASYPGQLALLPAYVDGLLAEARLWAARLPDFAPRTVFFGGGTPSLLGADDFARLTAGLGHVFDLSGVDEFTVEANPGTVDAAKLAAYAGGGVGRLSLGLQAAQPALLAALGRRHTPDDFARAVELCRAAGIDRINGDMMTGLPGQSVKDALDTAEFLLCQRVQHVSCYALRLEPGTPLAQRVAAAQVTLPGDDAERDLFGAVCHRLERGGLRRYEISNFAYPGDECRHNLLYWRRGEYIGLGCAAASFTGATRRTNRADIAGYLAQVNAGEIPTYEQTDIDADEAAFEEIMLGTRLTAGVDYAWFARRHGYDIRQRYAGVLQTLHSQGLLRGDAD